MFLAITANFIRLKILSSSAVRIFMTWHYCYCFRWFCYFIKDHPSDNGGFGKPKIAWLAYVQEKGPGLETISMKDELLKNSRFFKANINNIRECPFLERLAWLLMTYPTHNVLFKVHLAYILQILITIILF